MFCIVRELKQNMIDYNRLSDSELWNLITKEDNKAFNALFEKYWSKIYTTAFSYLKDNEACAEIVNDIFINIWKKRHDLHIESFAAYLTASSRYHVYKKVKALKTAKLDFVENYDSINNQMVNLNTADSKMGYQDLEKRIETYLAGLPKRCREIFIMSRQQHLSNDEIAQKLNISKRTVENQITHALKHLRVSLKDISVIIILLKLSEISFY